MPTPKCSGLGSARRRSESVSRARQDEWTRYLYQILQDQIKVMMLFQIKLDDVIVLVGSSNLVYPKAPETI